MTSPEGPDRRADRPPGHRARCWRPGRGSPPATGGSRGPTRKAAEIATGAPKPAAPSMKAPKEKADQDRLDPAVAREPGDRRLHDLELPGRDREVVEEDRRDDQPDDPEQREDHPDARPGEDQLDRHPEDADRPPPSPRSGPASAACQAGRLARAEQAEQDQDRDGGGERRQGPGTRAGRSSASRRPPSTAPITINGQEHLGRPGRPVRGPASTAGCRRAHGSPPPPGPAAGPGLASILGTGAYGIGPPGDRPRRPRLAAPSAAGRPRPAAPLTSAASPR